MNKKTVERISKGTYIALMVLAAIAAIVAMVTGPMGMDKLSYTASACACVIAVMVLIRAISAMTSNSIRK